ncbi:MAG: glycosyltransferase family 2 protein [Planctomycetota bacterium]|jgi:glycosyltransferase involved in cell wall biosynthesis
MPLRIAAIVTAFNRPNVVLEALESVAAQSRPPDVLVAVDDGSSNETADGIETWLARADLAFPATLERLKQNEGLAAARNHGVAAAGPCDLIAFLDDDDLWPPDYLERMEAAFLEHPDAIVACCDREDVNVRTGRRRFRDLRGITSRTAEWLIVVGLPGNPNTVYRAAAFRDAGGFDPRDRVAEDYPIMLRLSRRGQWLHVPGAPVIVRREVQDHVTGAPRLSKKHAHGRHRVAQMLETFLIDEGGRDIVPARAWRQRLGRMWYGAGRELAAAGQGDEARACFRRALQYVPWHVRSRLRSLGRDSTH